MKKNRILLIICWIIIANNLQLLAHRALLENDWNIQEYNRYMHRLEQITKEQKKYEQFQAEPPARDYDVISYSIYLDWTKILTDTPSEPTEKKWNGKVNIQLKSKISYLDRIELDCVGLEINKVFIENIELENHPTPEDNKLIIPLEVPINYNNELNLSVDYTYVGADTNLGFCIYYKGHTVAGRQTEETVAYTINSPRFACFWVPCNDAPGDKAKLTMSVAVPEDYSVASNGNLVSNLVDEQNKTRTFIWSDTTQIATFLINATASKYKEYSEYFKSPNRPDSIEIKYYIWENNYDGAIYSAVDVLKNTPKMLEFYSRIYGDYPFCKYGTVEVSPFVYSAMENQTMTAINKYIIQGQLGLENTIAHEIAHQWFGDFVSSKNWYDIWFKEGGATWSEALWAEEYKKQEIQYFYTMRDKAAEYINAPELFTRPLNSNDATQIFAGKNVFLSYNKASWLYHMLYLYLGKDKMLQILRDLFETYKYGNIDAAEFKSFFVNATKDMNLDWNVSKYFDQWLYGAGHIIYDCQSIMQQDIEDVNTYNVNLMLTQIQEGENVTEVFETPIYIAFMDKNKIVHLERVLNNQKVQEYNFTKIPYFTTCKVDSLRTLCRNAKTITSISEHNDNNFNIYPNPAIGQQFVYINCELEEGVNTTKPELSNVLGSKIEIPTTKINTGYQLNINNLPQGIYYIKWNNKVNKINIIK